MNCSQKGRLNSVLFALVFALVWLLPACADRVSTTVKDLQALELVSPAEGDQIGANRVKLTGWCPVGSSIKITYGSGFAASNVTTVPCEICTGAYSPSCESKFNTRGKYEFVAQLTGTSGARNVTLDLIEQNKLISIRRVVRALTYQPISQAAYLKPSHRRTSFINFGSGGAQSIAVNGDTMLVGDRTAGFSFTSHHGAGAPTAGASTVNKGVVYVFRHDGVNWAQEAILTAPYQTENYSMYFGTSVSLSGDVAVVGSPTEDTDLAGVRMGADIPSGQRREDASVKASAQTAGGNSGAAFVFRRTGSTWAVEALLKSPYPDNTDNFGQSVAIDGDRVVVGANLEDSSQTTVTNGTGASSNNSAKDSGAAYIFDRVGGVWGQVAYLKAANADAGDAFGVQVAVSGDTVAVASSAEASNQTTITNGTTASSNNSAASAGAVYVYRLTGSTWAQEAYIKAGNADASDQFGSALSLYGSTLAVGAQGEDSNQITITNGTGTSADNTVSSSGAVYVYTRSGATWAQEAYLKAGNANASDIFGVGISLYADTLAVGAQAEDSNLTTVTNGTGTSANNGVSNSGAVYVYKRTAGSWAQEAYIKAPNADAADTFGRFVSVHGDWVIGTAAAEASSATGVTNGAASADNSYTAVGAVYSYRRTGVNWAFSAYFKPPSYGHYTGFGNRGAADGDTLVIAAKDDDSGDATITNAATYTPATLLNNAGTVYVFRLTGGNWAQEAVLKAPNAGASDAFGEAVAISGDTIVVGAGAEDSNQTTITNGTTASANNSNSSSGAAYVFHRAGSTWSQQAYLKPSNSEAGDGFGTSVAIDGDTIVVGADEEDSNQTTITNGATASADNSASAAGAAYVFTRTGVNWAQTAYLKAPNAEAEDYFGRFLVVSGDRIAVLAADEDGSYRGISNGYLPDDNLTTDQGAVYTYTRSGGNWSFQSYIKSPVGGADDGFGNWFSLDGDTLAISALYEAVNGLENRGAIYILHESDGAWSQTAKLTAPAYSGGRFGTILSLKGNYLLTVGPLDSRLEAGVTDATLPTVAASNTEVVGVGYLYKKKSLTEWQLTNFLKPSLLYNQAVISVPLIGTNFFALAAGSESNDQIGVTNGSITHGGYSPGFGAVYVFHPDP